MNIKEASESSVKYVTRCQMIPVIYAYRVIPLAHLVDHFSRNFCSVSPAKDLSDIDR